MHLENARRNLPKIMLALILFGYFFYISRQVPLTGDDWDYANKAMQYGVIGKAVELYMTWSGRFISDTYTLFMSLHKGIWNFANAMLFTGVFLLMCYLADSGKNKLAVLLTCAALMLGVNRDIRIETYFWINGAHFTLPLLLMLGYFSLLNQYMAGSGKKNPAVMAGIVITGFLGSLCSENATVIMVLGSIILVFGHRWTGKKLSPYFLLITVIPALIMFLSPGMKYRLAAENSAWATYSVIKKISLNWPSMISFTFARNSILMILLGIALLAAILGISKAGTVKKPALLFMGIMNTACILLAAGEAVYERGHLAGLAFLLDYENSGSAMLLISVFFLLFVISVFLEVCMVFPSEQRFKPLFTLILACAGNSSMMLSPSFQARSSLYTVYLLGLLTLLLLDHAELPAHINRSILAISLVISAVMMVKWMRIYKEVARIQSLRMEQVAYYQGHWDETQIYLPRFPAYYIHGGDIEIGDDLHKEAYLLYYKMNPKADLYFYKLPEYINQ